MKKFSPTAGARQEPLSVLIVRFIPILNPGWWVGTATGANCLTSVVKVDRLALWWTYFLNPLWPTSTTRPSLKTIAAPSSAQASVVDRYSSWHGVTDLDCPAVV